MHAGGSSILLPADTTVRESRFLPRKCRRYDTIVATAAVPRRVIVEDTREAITSQSQS